MKYLSRFKKFLNESAESDGVTQTNKSIKLDPKQLAKPKPGRVLAKGGTEAVACWQERLLKGGAKIKVDGIWGRGTQAAFVAYTQKKHGDDSPIAKKASKGTAPAIAKFSPGIESMGLRFFKATMDNISKLATKVGTGISDALIQPIKDFMKTSAKLLPLHVRGVLYFMVGRESVFDASELDAAEMKALYNYSQELLTQKKDFFTYPFWNSKSKGLLPMSLTKAAVARDKAEIEKRGESSILTPTLAGQFAYFLGQTAPKSIVIQGTTITIKDFYDFNEANGANTTDLLKAVAIAIKDKVSGEGSTYTVVRRIVAMRQKTGYKGFPVNLVLQKPAV